MPTKDLTTMTLDELRELACRVILVPGDHPNVCDKETLIARLLQSATHDDNQE